MKVKIEYNVSDLAAGLIMKTGDFLSKESDKFLSRFNIATGHYNVLRILNGAGEPLSQIEISRQLISSRANVTKLVDKLENMKLVQRIQAKDRRINLISITAAGSRLLNEIAPADIKNTARLMEKLSLSEQKELLNILKKI
jgi:MarR family 2-MHQ and catechol resistance regulon transcriptional repressor